MDQELHPPAEFIRLPRAKQRCAVCGLSRTTLNELIDGGKIKAVKLRKRHAQRGIVLINRASLLEYLHGMESQEKQPFDNSETSKITPGSNT